MRRNLLWGGGAIVAVYLVTGLVGVPAVVRQLPALESREIVTAVRASRHATERSLKALEGASLAVRIHSAFAVLPGVVVVTYDYSLGHHAFPRSTRVVLWFGAGACFLGSGELGARA